MEQLNRLSAMQNAAELSGRKSSINHWTSFGRLEPESSSYEKPIPHN
jgi:hypothetical protein